MPRRPLPPRLYFREDEQQWTIRDGARMHRLGLSREEYSEAVQRLSAYLAGLETHKKPGPARADDITVGEILSAYVEGHGPTVKSARTLLYCLKALAPFWADMACSQANGPAMRRYAAERGVASGTVRREIAVLNAALRWAFKEGILSDLVLLPRPPDGPPRDRWVARDELAPVLNHMRGRHRRHAARAMLIMFYTGTRLSATLRLRWVPSMDTGWVDLDRGVLHRRGAGEVETKKRRGSCRMPQSLLAQMRCWHRADLRREAEGGAAALHVCGYAGEPVHSVKTALRAAFVDCDSARLGAGLDPVDRFTAHAMKHSAVTRAFQGGMTIEDAVDYFSTSRGTLERVYRHHHPDHQRRAAEIMDRKGRET